MATFAGARPGSGKNFAKLKTSLAKRGAKNPGALAAYIGRRKYGRKGFARLASHSHSNPADPGLPRAAAGVPRPGAEPSRRLPVRDASDVVVSRSPEGYAVLRHRAGGERIGSVRRDGPGWRASLEGRGDLAARVHERTAVQDLISNWNSTAQSPYRRAPAVPLQAPPAQTELMRQYGIPAIRALATPVTSAGSGPRMTGADGDADDLGPTGSSVYRRLRRRGFPHERAHSFARRAQNLKARKRKP